MAIGCRICGFKNLELQKTIKRNVLREDKHFLFYCSKCETGFIPEDFNEISWQTYNNELNKKISIKNTIKDTNNRISNVYPVYYKLLEKYIVSGNSILDVGCYSGGFLNEVSKDSVNYDLKLFGTDISEDWLNIAIHNNLYNSTITFFKNNLLKDIYKFDIITMNQVLEHQLNPVNFIKKYMKFLKKDGTMFITVPYVKKKDLLRKLSFPRHLFYFNKTSFEYLMLELNLKIVELGLYIKDSGIYCIVKRK